MRPTYYIARRRPLSFASLATRLWAERTNLRIYRPLPGFYYTERAASLYAERVLSLSPSEYRVLDARDY